MNSSEIDTLNEIVELEGDCLMYERCRKCPFKVQCHRSIVRSYNGPFGKPQRLAAALDALFNLAVMGDEDLPSVER